MTNAPPPTQLVIDFVADVITPLFEIKRTVAMPFDINRLENDGEHSLALALLAGALKDHVDPSLDSGKIVTYAMIHDIVEIYAGDVTVWDDDEKKRAKSTNESEAAERILAEFPSLPWVGRTYQEYEASNSPEKRYVYALDKLHPYIMVLAADHHPVNPSWEKYKEAESVAREKITSFPALLPLFDGLCAQFRLKPHFFSTPIPQDQVTSIDETLLSPSADEVVELVREVIAPLFNVERTMVMPFDLNRHESYGEHSLALGLLANSLAKHLAPSLDLGKISEYAAVHDIVHIHTGDVSVWEPDNVIRNKSSDETLAAEHIERNHPLSSWITQSYHDYRLQDSPEKCFVRALHKMYPHILILLEDYHPVHPSWEAYKRTEEIARADIKKFPALLPLFDELCTLFRTRPHFFSTPVPPEERV